MKKALSVGQLGLSKTKNTHRVSVCIIPDIYSSWLNLKMYRFIFFIKCSSKYLGICISFTIIAKNYFLKKSAFFLPPHEINY